MQRETISRKTFVKGVTAVAVTAASLGTLKFAKYPSTENYTASATGMESDVNVTLVMDGEVIKDVVVDVSGETDGIGAAIGDEVRQQILDAQSADIDGVAGASVTSEAVRAAVRDALRQAGIEVAEPETQAPETELPAPETEAAAGEDAQTEADQADLGTADAGAAASGNTFSGSAFGMESDVVVTLTVEDGTIVDADVDVSGETQGIGAAIGDATRQQILDAQSADIDGVAGATVSSDAVRAAAAAALEAAGLGTGVQAEAAETEIAEAETEPAETEIAETEIAETEIAETEPVKTEITETGNTFSGSAFGMESDVVVTLTVEDGTIVDADVDVSGETQGIGAAIGDATRQQILDAQSAQIDGVAGATVSSDAVRAAAAAALEAAGLGTGVQAGADEAEAAETEAAETEATETEAVETEIAETELAETEAAETEITETEIAESEIAETEAAETEIAETELAETVLTYTGYASGAASIVKVVLTVADNQVTDVAVDVSGETLGAESTLAADLAAQIAADPFAPIDAVAGATITSNAVAKAAASAVAKAGLSADASAPEAVDALEEGTESSTERYDQAIYVPGTYTGRAQGMESEVIVEITVDETSITDVKIDVAGETQGIGAAIGDEMATRLIKAQSADIDVVAGASVTSAALIDAATAAIAEASGK